MGIDELVKHIRTHEAVVHFGSSSMGLGSEDYDFAIHKDDVDELFDSFKHIKAHGSWQPAATYDDFILENAELITYVVTTRHGARRKKIDLLVFSTREQVEKVRKAGAMAEEFNLNYASFMSVRNNRVAVFQHYLLHD